MAEYDAWAVYYDLETLRIYQTQVRMQNTQRVVTFDWSGQETIDGVTFCLDRVMGDTTISMERLAFPESVPPKIFTDPRVQMP